MENRDRKYRGYAAMSLLEEVEKLRNAPLPDVRVSVAEKVSEYFGNSVFDKFEDKLACEILRLLARDVEVRVRKVLAENLKSNSSIPHDIALSLANDVLEVSAPILEFSSLLTDDDLLRIINSAEDVAKLEVITKRKQISKAVSGALIHTEKENVVKSLLANAGASIAENDMQEVINKFRDNNDIVEKLVFRGDLSVSIIVRAMEFVTGELKEKLEKDYKLSKEVAQEVTEKALESATVGILDTESNQTITMDFSDSIKDADDQGVPALDKMAEPMLMKKTKELVDYLHRGKKLTPSIVLRALCEGNLVFFEIGMSRLAGIPVQNAHMLVWASNPTAFHSLYKRAEMPMSTLPAVELVLLFMKQECISNSWGVERKRLRQRVVERLLSGGYEHSIPLMPYFITLINSKVTTRDVLN